MAVEFTPAAAGCRILIAESHELTARAIGRTLESAGFRVDRIADESGLADLNDFDACLIAGRLGNEPGATVIRELRQKGVTAPIVALVGWSDWAGRDELMNSGADSVLMKPCGAAEMIGLLQRLLERAHPEVTRAEGSGSVRPGIAMPVLVTALIGLGISLTLWLLQ